MQKKKVIKKENESNLRIYVENESNLRIYAKKKSNNERKESNRHIYVKKVTVHEFICEKEKKQANDIHWLQYIGFDKINMWKEF